MLSLVLCFCQCFAPISDDKKVNQKETGMYFGNSKVEFKIYKFEGCEYLGKVNGFDTDVLTHKGNCSNPIHNK